MALGGYSIVSVSWDCCPSAIFKPLSWHGANTHQYVHAHTQCVTSTYTRDNTGMLFSTHYMLISQTPCLFFLLTVSFKLFLFIFSALKSTLFKFSSLFFSLPCPSVPTLALTRDVFYLGRLQPHSLPPTLVHMFYTAGTHTRSAQTLEYAREQFSPPFRLMEQQQNPVQKILFKLYFK